MLASHSHEFIYLKTHKTAGTSIEMFLQPFCHPSKEPINEQVRASVGPQGIVGMRNYEPADYMPLDRLWWDHMPAALVREKLGARIFDRYTKVAACRDPFEKIVSQFYFRVSRGRENYPASIDEARSKIESFAQSPQFQDSREVVLIDDKLAVDRFIRYEHLADDLSDLARDLECDFSRTVLPHSKPSRHAWLGNTLEHLTDATIATIQDRCAWMFEFCGYDRTPVDRPPNYGVQIEGADQAIGELMQLEFNHSGPNGSK